MSEGARHRTDRWAELAMAAVPVVLAALTFLILVDPTVAPAAINPALDVTINASATLVAIAVAILGWVHYREGGDPAALLRASAFLVLGAMNALVLLSTVSGLDAGFGLSLDDPGQLPLWAAVVTRGVAAGLFVVAAAASLGQRSPERWPAALVLWLPALGVIAAIIVAASAQDMLPPLLSGDALTRLQYHPQATLIGVGIGFFGPLQVVIGLGYLGAAALSYRLYRRERNGTEALYAVGMTVAAFSQVQAAIHPGTYASLVTTGDLLRVGFYAVILVTIASQSREDARALRHANAEIVRLREADMARATAEERARLAREIHDGMSQELWFAKLNQARLSSITDLSDEARELAREVTSAIDSALAEARQAIVALRPSDAGTFAQVIERFVEDFSDRFGIRAESRCDPAAAERLSPRVQAELLRIIQEALNNARKHADPTRLRVELIASDGGVQVTIGDNGRGFDPASVGGGYGLRSMHERAALIGASVVIDSQPQNGTRVVVELPSWEVAR